MNETLERIAREYLNVSLESPEVVAWGIKDALAAAYNAGKAEND